MRVLEIVEHGSPLRSAEHPDPVAAPDEVVVRIEAAGICRSDVHYWSGTRPVPSLPLVPGHEVAGTVVAVGSEVSRHEEGDRVALHYLVTCGGCRSCRDGAEQFCESGAMLGLDRQGGYAEAIAIPERNAHPIPSDVSMQAAAVMMCSGATSLHALRRARLQVGETVGVFGCGGLGMAAIQLAIALGAGRVLAVDVNPAKLEAASELGATPIAGGGNVAEAVRAVAPQGVDVGLELVGSSELMGSILNSLGAGGRGVAVGITDTGFDLDPYRDLVTGERELVGVSDHLGSEIDELLAMAQSRVVDFDRVVTKTISLTAQEVNDALRKLESFGDDVRTVIVS